MKVSVVYAMMQDADAEEVLSTFPSVTAAFAYGSGAVEQGGYNYSDEKGGAELPMLDMVFAVEDPVQWHEENMRQNPGYLSLSLSLSFFLSFFLFLLTSSSSSPYRHFLFSQIITLR